MSGLTREERSRMIQGFLMASGSIALAMVLFALIGQLDNAAVVVAAMGIVVVMASCVHLLLRHSARVVIGTMVAGVAVVTGAFGGSFIIHMVVAALN